MEEADWLQSTDGLANPFTNDTMKTCGTLVRKFSVEAGAPSGGGGQMISKIIDFSIKNRLLVLLLTFALIAASIWSVYHLSLDAIPDLSDVQVIIVTENEGQNPEVMDEQVTYPLASAMLSVPHATAVRGYSMFGLSFVYVIFDDGTDIYWARSRVLEYLNFARDRLPKGVEPKLGPDATGVGWVYQYVLYPGYYSSDHPKGLFHDAAVNEWYARRDAAPADRQSSLVLVRAWEQPGKDPLTGRELLSSNQDLASLRSIQDWYLRYPLTSIPGVSEVAPIGGFVKQYQVVLDPTKLKAFNIPLKDIMMAVQRSNNDVGGATIEQSENEYMVRSRGYLHGVSDLENVPVGMGGDGTPVRLADVARVQIGGEMRRGIGEYNGQGELAGGVIVARFGENAYRVIQDVKAKLADLEEGLPPGVLVKATYDRSSLIERSIHTLRAYADRRNHRRRAGLHPFSAPRPQRIGRRLRGAGVRAGQSAAHAFFGCQCQHHEPGGYRHRDWRGRR